VSLKGVSPFFEFMKSAGGLPIHPLAGYERMRKEKNFEVCINYLLL
jgi:hypothetical protein